MQKRITTSITYELPIKEFTFVKTILAELNETSRRLGKSRYWKLFIENKIKNGLKVVFLHLWNTEEQWFDGLHYKEEMVFGTFIGFDSIGMNLYSMGEFAIESIDALCEKYENNPEFIFTQLDWDASKEEIIKDLITELMEGDFVEEP